jgi:hypothetical protein
MKSDAWYLTTYNSQKPRGDFSEGYNTFGIEWSKDYLFTYINSRLNKVLSVDFTKQTMWQKGQFANRLENYTILQDPWLSSGNKNAPFDQKFYLILNVAVGSRNGWFEYVFYSHSK